MKIVTAASHRRNSGQVLIITSLIVVMLLLSTVIYVTETQRNSPTYDNRADPAFSAIRQGALHTVISALANISRGGAASVLVTDLNLFESAITSHSASAILNVDVTPLNTTPYQNGTWISWGSSGEGVSSAYVSFEVNSTHPAATHYSEFAVNVTSRIVVGGFYEQLTGASKEVNLTCTVSNKGEAALAQNLTVYYERDGSLSPEEWIQAASVATIDYGNGTYLMSFTAKTDQRSNPMLVSVHCTDLRGIFVRANATCTLVG